MLKTRSFTPTKPSDKISISATKTLHNTNGIGHQQIAQLNACGFNGSDPFISVWTSQSEKNPGRQYYSDGEGQFLTWVDDPKPKRKFQQKKTSNVEMTQIQEEIRTLKLKMEAAEVRADCLEKRIYDLEHYDESMKDYS